MAGIIGIGKIGMIGITGVGIKSVIGIGIIGIIGRYNKHNRYNRYNPGPPPDPTFSDILLIFDSPGPPLWDALGALGPPYFEHDFWEPMREVLGDRRAGVGGGRWSRGGAHRIHRHPPTGGFCPH